MKIVKKRGGEKSDVVNSSLKTIVKGAGVVFIVLMLGKVLGYFYTIIAARLGTEEFGMLNLGYSLVSFLIVFSLSGMHAGVLRYASYYLGKKDFKRVKGALMTSIKICLPLSIFFSAIMFIFADKLAILVFHNAKLTFIFRVFSVIVPFTTLTTIFGNFFRSFQKIEYDVINTEIVEKSVRLVFTIFFIGLGLGVFGASIAYIISSAIVFLVSLFLLETKVFPIIRKKMKTVYYMREMIAFSFPLLLTSFLLFIIGWIATIMLGLFKTTSEVGIYNAANPTASLLIIIPSALTALFMPIITRFYSQNKMNEVKKLYGVVSRWVFFATFPIFIVLLSFPRELLRIMFSEEYVIGASALQILAFGFMFHSLTYTNQSVLNMAKKTKTVFFITLSAAILNIILNYFLIQRYGFIGASIGTCFSFVFGAIMVMAFSYSIVKQIPFTKSYIKAIIASVISLLLVYYGKRIFTVSLNLVTFTIMLVFFCVIYAAILFLSNSFEDEDKSMIKSFLSRLKI